MLKNSARNSIRMFVFIFLLFIVFSVSECSFDIFNWNNMARDTFSFYSLSIMLFIIIAFNDD